MWIFSYKYVKYVITLAVIGSIILQFAWLSQLFNSQKLQLKHTIEDAVVQSSKLMIYNSLSQNNIHGLRFKEFFLSQQWLNLRQAFDNLNIEGLKSNFNYGITKDSTIIQMNISFNNVLRKPDINNKARVNHQMVLSDTVYQHSLKMDSVVRSILVREGIKVNSTYALYNYKNDKLLKTGAKNVSILNNAYISEKYSFDLNHLYKYQLVVMQLNSAVFYQMRYYLISALTMIVLTFLAFVFLIKLIRNQKLYSDAKATFTNNMTHEFKTPVATISIAIESILKYNLIRNPVKLKSYLNISQLEIQRLNLMFEKLMNLNGLNDAKEYNLEPYNLVQNLNQIVKSMELQSQKENAAIFFEPDNNDYWVKGDMIHLSNVFYNLLDNALKYGSQNVIIRISCKNSGHEHIITIEDNGPGIDPLFQKKVFERFFRIPTEDIHNVKGSGLGLHYVKDTIERHQGSIRLRSVVGQGAVFIISLPKL
ncbi:HAMP domain-containing histidine kinase [Mucilaginibacter sp. HC2]|uniref:sensor histidine kinase n=1 Tax=Mucilaginibacter inviolabilis TaxID=2714892 RepID=UPI0014099A05|nr:HAMP domain-containing sensor histidine kinase [Mucilaginibacter inviolabilis]NHA05817.1 HAMP domain-containing histidine kinase [Mucilaginibacter inviolabilis]